jgi:acyl transferase domain-containing protein/NADPH:quinone reductase-like Zn-dependent oxidoreductase/SAM-dependent methyltransferase/acyl carrier protein
MSAELTPLQRAFLALEETRAKLAAVEARQREPIAVVGIGCRFPGGISGPSDYWSLLNDARSGISTVPVSRWDHAPFFDTIGDRPGTTYAQHAGFLDVRVDEFDAQFFGISPREAAAMDPQQRLLLEVAWEALEHAGIAPDRLAGTATGVFVGVTASDYAQLQLRGGTLSDIDAHYASGIAHSIASGRLSYLLGLQGPSLSIDTACSSSLVAVHLACQSLRSGECDAALAAGVNLILTPESFIAFARTHMLAPDGRCKPFDASADGFVRGEGCGVVVLKRISDVIRNGDRILAVIRGSAVNQDGASASLTAPSGPAQEAVIRRALSQAALTPADVQFVEAHGTGTSLGDPIELRALGAVYGAARQSGADDLVVGSVKANFGHLEGSAGVASLIKAVLALDAARVPGQLHIETPTPHVDWPTLHLRLPPRDGEVWPTAVTRRAAVSSFGFSGTNAHVIVEQAPAQQLPATVVSERPVQIIPIAARSAQAVRELATDYAPCITDADTLRNVAHTASVGRAQLLGARAAVVCTMPADAIASLALIAGGEQIMLHAAGSAARAAFLFTGQGSQSAGMARELYDSAPIFRASIDASAAVLVTLWSGTSLSDVLYGEHAEALLADARYVQPAIVAVELALAALWRSWGVEPVVVAGHSLGEYAAAAIAGVMTETDALRLVAARGRLMAALPAVDCAMTSVPASVAMVQSALGDTFGRSVELAADNGPAQCVLTGLTADIEVAETLLRNELGVECRRLVATTNAFHSRHIEPMLDAFEREAQAISFAAPIIPVSWNLGRTVLASHLAPDASYWRRQTRQAVQFGDAIASLRERGVTHAIEIGPHPVLSGLVAAADDSQLPVGVASLRRGRGSWETIANGVAQWWAAGGNIDWVKFDAPYARRTIALPTYPFARERHWLSYAKVGVSRREITPGHALVGSRLSSPSITGVVFEREISAPDMPLLNQHRIHGRAILPGASWLDAFASAAATAFADQRWSVSGLTLHAPLHVPDDQPRTVQIVIATSANGSAAVEAYSRDASDVNDAWTLHARASLEVLADASANRAVVWPTDSTLVQARLYDRFALVGLTLGPQFNLVQQVTQRDGAAIATIDTTRLPQWTDGIVHPAVIDACIQSIALAVAAPADGDDALYMPLAVERFAWYAPTPTTFVCEAVLRPGSASGETIVADVIATDTDGRVVGELTGITLKRAAREALRFVDGDKARDSMYEMQWEARALDSGASATAPVPLSEITARVVAQGPVRAAALSLERYATDGPAMDRLAAAYIWQAIDQLGAHLAVGDSVAAGSLADQLRVEARHRQLFARLLDILVEDDVLRRDGDTYHVLHSVDTSIIAEAVAELRAGDGTPFSGELNLLVRCGDKLGPALIGKEDPLALLFPNGSLDEVHRIYRDSPFPRTFNALVRDAIATLVASRTGTRPLRILEVGGGTGGTTAAVLDAIADGACEYVFTDASPLFLAKAGERFANRSEMSYRVFDLERDANSQGFTAASFDLIVGANVIHATRDVGATVGALHELLVPDGVLMMLEMSRPARWVDLSFGFTEGWWAFADVFRTDYPLLNSAGWTRVLESVGFTEIAIALGTPGSGAGLEEQSMVFARKRGGSRVVSATWVVLADETGVGRAITERLAATGDRVVCVERSGHAWDRARIVRELELAAASGAISGVVSCLALDESTSADAGSSMPECATRVATMALSVAQAVLTFTNYDTSDRPRLTFVTQCAVRVDHADRATSPAQATVLGIARSLQLEHPELNTTSIDLPLVASVEQLDALSGEVRAASLEQQIAFRQVSRYVARIDRAQPLTPQFPAAYRVAPKLCGAIEALEITADSIPTPAAGDVVIRVAATGLNFKDVLNVLGTYPGDAGAIGGECAGYVAAIGDGVTGRHIGERILALASAALGSHVTTDAALVVGVPDGMSLDTAAALPIAYLTAYHTLFELGHLSRGERVLIHAGAGGVGMAAIHLAKRAGAEIFATAGSDAKRAYLRGLGVPHVFDSRTLSFADEILAVTNGDGVHVTLNSLSDAFVERSLAVTARGGRFLEIGKRGIWTPEQVAALGKNLSYRVVDWTELARTSPARIGNTLRTLLADVARGDLPALPTEVFPLSRMHDAFRFMAQGRHTGKIVISHREALDADGARSIPVSTGAAYVVIGGTSGIGLLAAEWLADRGATHLVLASRSGATAESRAAVTRLTARNVRVDVEATDVSDATAVAAMLDRTRRVAPIRGVIQSAGLLDDGAVLQLDAERVAKVFAAKVVGTWNLHQATHDDALDFFVCFASVAGFLGSAGQANHAAANTFIDALAEMRRAEGRCAVSIDWGAWDKVGAAVRHGVLSRAANIGVRSISPNDGRAILDAVFTGSSAHVAALPVDWPTFLRTPSRAASPLFSRVAQRAAAATDRVASGTRPTTRTLAPERDGAALVTELTSAVATRRPSILRTFLRARVARTLGLADGTTVDDRAPLRDVGLDSLLAIELRNVVGAAIGRTLPATLLFDYPTIDDLSAYLLTALFPDAADSAATDVVTPTETPAALIDDLAAMSDDEVERLFAEKMRSKA